MIQLRKANGELIPLPKDVAFVELTDSSGDIGYVLTVDNQGFILGFDKDAPEATRYSKLFKVKFCHTAELGDTRN